MVGVRPDGNTPWGESWAVAWRALLASRVVVLVAGALAAGLLGLDPRHTGFDPAGITTPYGGLGDALLAPFARWDTTWFVAIAQDGYGDGAREAFFPLYPLLLAVGGTVTGGETVLAGIALSTAFAAVALTVLHRLVALDYGPAVARGAVLATAFMPMSFFLSAVYSESLFLMLSVGAVYAARTDRWAWAGILGGLSAATRSAGVVLLVPLVLSLVGRARHRGASATSLWLALVPAGVAAYCLYLWAVGRRPAGAVRGAGRLVPGVRGPVPGRVGRLRRRVGGRASAPVRLARAGVLHAGGRGPVRRRAPQHRAVRVARRRARGARARPAPAPARVPRLRRRGARAAAVLPGRCPSRSCRCHASCSCCSRSPSPSQPGRRSGGGAGPCSSR